MKLITCPEIWWPNSIEESYLSIFLAGGITNCPDWQSEFAEMLKDTHYILINPRRVVYDISDPVLGHKQIEWEHYYLKSTWHKVFWFPKETLCPITLFELGRYADCPSLTVGCHPEYARRFDVMKQLSLARPDGAEIFNSLEEMAGRFKAYLDVPDYTCA